MSIDPDSIEGNTPEWRDYSRLMLESFLLACPLDVILGRIESAFLKLGRVLDGEDTNIERVLFVSADLLRAATELNVTCTTWYATAHQTNTQLMFADASPRQKAQMVSIAKRRANATLKSALEQAAEFRRQRAQSERNQPLSGAASAPHY
jgi:hypothetical protein